MMVANAQHKRQTPLPNFNTTAILCWAVVLIGLSCTAVATSDQPVDGGTFSDSPWHAQIESLVAVQDELRAPAAPDATLPAICVIVRTFWGHGGKNMEQRQQGLRSLLASLRAQKNPRWEALLVVMDSKPFGDLHHILQEVSDDRVWIFAEWVGVDFTPKIEGRWTAGYHERLYNLTDDAIRACPDNTEWLLVTNGDNEYATTLFSQLEQAGNADIVAFDFYSRYQRITGPPCERFGLDPQAPACKVNELRWCQTDLGANALRWPRWMREGRQFGGMAARAAGLPAEHFDGILAQALAAEGWPSKHVHHCLFDHSPSPQRCASLGAVWDDTGGAEDIGGRCVNPWQASRRMKDGHGSYEEVVVHISHDEHMHEFLSNKNGTALRCIRHRDVITQQYERMAYFGPMCASECDLASHGAASFVEWAAGFNERLLEDLQKQQAETLLPDVPGQMPSEGKISFRDIL